MDNRGSASIVVKSIDAVTNSVLIRTIIGQSNGMSNSTFIPSLPPICNIMSGAAGQDVGLPERPVPSPQSPGLYRPVWTLMVPPFVSCASRSRAAKMVARCSSTSPGAPTGLPIGCWVSSSLGSSITSIRGRKAATAMVTVGIPSISSNRATCPTDTWHTGQTGTSSAASICC